MDVKQFLQNYVNVVQWDLKKMALIAEEAQNLQDEEKRRRNQYTGPTPAPTPSVFGTTINHSSEYNYGSVSFFDSHKPEFARCAIPIAMVLTSSVEFLGALMHDDNLWSRDNRTLKFSKAVNKFFDYAQKPLTENQVNLYRAIYRNGSMHSFFPQGVGIAINYDTRFNNYPLFFLNTQIDCIELNVIELQKIVESVFAKIINDTSIYCRIEARYNNYKAQVDQDTTTIISGFRDNIPPTSIFS